jgi:hypothetical protein
VIIPSWVVDPEYRLFTGTVIFWACAKLPVNCGASAPQRASLDISRNSVFVGAVNVKGALPQG